MTNTFIPDDLTSDTETCDIGVNLFTDLCNKMLAGQMQSPLWLEYCINERTSYLAQVTEFPLIQDSLVLMNEIIDNAIL